MLPQWTIAPTASPSRSGSATARTAIVRRAVRARLAARLRGRALDRALIEGADPAAEPQLEARAALLTSRRSREALAEGLERLLDGTHGPRRRWWAISRRDALLENAGEIRAIARLLRARTPVYASGIAVVWEMLGDGTSPAYRGGGYELAQRLAAARTALAHGSVR
jgi:hypothetical protein